MKRLLMTAALLAAGAAMAEDAVFYQRENVLRLHTGACTHVATRERIKPEWRDAMRQAHALVRGKDIAGCWRVNDEGTVIVIFEDGDYAALPHTAFQKDEGI